MRYEHRERKRDDEKDADTRDNHGCNKTTKVSDVRGDVIGVHRSSSNWDPHMYYRKDGAIKKPYQNDAFIGTMSHFVVRKGPKTAL